MYIFLFFRHIYTGFSSCRRSFPTDQPPTVSALGNYLPRGQIKEQASDSYGLSAPSMEVLWCGSGMLWSCAAKHYLIKEVIASYYRPSKKGDVSRLLENEKNKWWMRPVFYFRARERKRQQSSMLCAFPMRNSDLFDCFLFSTVPSLVNAKSG